MKKPFATLLIRVNVDSKKAYEDIIFSMCKHDICDKFDFLCYNDNEVIANGDCKCINKEENEYELECTEEKLD